MRLTTRVLFFVLLLTASVWVFGQCGSSSSTRQHESTQTAPK